MPGFWPNSTKIVLTIITNSPHGIMDKHAYPINSALSNSKTKVTLEFLLNNAQQKTEFHRFAKSKYIHTLKEGHMNLRTMKP